MYSLISPLAVSWMIVATERVPYLKISPQTVIKGAKVHRQRAA